MGYWSLVYRILGAIIRAGFTSMAHKSAIAEYENFILASQNYEDTNGYSPRNYEITVRNLEKKIKLAYRNHLEARTVREELFAEYKNRCGYDFPL